MASLVEDLASDLARSNAVVLLGAGVSVAATDGSPLASWTGLLHHGVNHCVKVVSSLPLNWAQTLRSQIDSGDSFSLDDALAVFRNEIRPVLPNLPDDIQIVVERNENDVRSARLEPGSVEEFYRLVDRQRLLGVDLSDLKTILAAEDDAAAQKHHSAFPAFWRELVRAYHQACWRPYCWAAKRLADECVRVGLYHEATHHAVMADDKDLAGRLGQQLIGARSMDGIRWAVDTLLAIANLQRHFTIACEIIETVGDGVPDDQVDRVFQWLMRRCSIDPGNLGEMNTLSAAWKALCSIAMRLDSNQAQHVVRTATGHRFWSKPHPVYRREMIRVLELCAPRLRRQDLALLADRTLAAVRETKNDFDYPDAINLLCNRNRVRLSESQWRQLASSARMALQSGVILRRSAAAAVTRLLSCAPRGEPASRMSEVKRAYAQDVCYSVRKAAGYRNGKRQPTTRAVGR